MGKEEVGQVMFCAGTPTWAGGSLLHEGLARRGCMVVPTGNMGSPEQQIDAMATFGTTYLYGTASYVHRITEEGRKIRDLKSLGIKGIYIGAEPNSKAFRNYLEEVWGAKVYDGYGMMEMGAGVGGECSERNGYHIDLYIAVEVVDPQTGEPLAAGEQGELVFTTLGREASPLLRYRSGDISRLLPDEPCPCGMLPTRKMSNILGRRDDVLFLGTGEKFYPIQLDQAMVGIPGLVGYQMVVGQDGYKDTVLLRIESPSPSPELAENAKHRLYETAPFIRHDVEYSQTIAEPTVEFVTPGTFQKANPVKVRRVVDTRK
jgi:phenylacetate-CoA ligase